MSAPEGMDPLREKFLLSQDNRRNIRNKYRNLDRAAAGASARARGGAVRVGQRASGSAA